MNLTSRLLILFFLNIFFIQSILSQNSSSNSPRPIGKITGTVIDESTGEAVEYANVALYSTKDSSLLSGSITKPNGSFVIDNVRMGNFYLKISFIGYIDYIKKDIRITPDNSNANIGKIKLSSNSALLQEVEITAERSVMEYKLDKRVINVDKNIVTSGGTATDVLENVPSVSVDNDGNVTLRGSSNVKILIDGRPSELLGNDIQQILEQIPATTIETVEIITNPSAKYNPEGMSGIINIKLKEKTNRGLNGIANLNAGSALPQLAPNISGSLNLNYSVGKFNLYTIIDGSTRKRINNGDSDMQKFRNNTLFSDVHQDQHNENKNKSGSIKFGAEYQINPKNNIMMSYQYRKSKRENTGEIVAYDYVGPQSNYTENTSSDRNNNNHNVTLSYLRSFSQKNRELSFDASWGYSKDDGTTDMKQIFNNSSIAPYLQTSNSDGKDNNLYLQLNYIHPFSEKIKLETGYNGTFNTTEKDYLYYRADTNGNQYLDTLNSNNFTYKENINALYATLSYEITRKLSAQAGLRFEYVNTKEEQPAIPEGGFTKDYTSLYPTVHASYAISQTQSTQLSYSRRVRRPSMWQLNPFRNYSNPETIEFGNPKLNPEYTNSIELNYNKIFPTTNIFASIYFRQTNDIINRFQFLWTEENAEKYGFYWDGDTSNRTASTFMNLDKGINYGLEVVADQKITKWWRINVSINLYNSSVNGSSMGFEETKSGILTNCKLNSYMNLPWDIVLQLSGQYRSGWITIQGKMDPSYFFDLALKKDILKKSATINIRMSDIFATRKFGGTVDTPEIQSSFTSKSVTPVLSIGFSYKINQGAKKQRSKPIPNQMNEDEGNGMDM